MNFNKKLAVAVSSAVLLMAGQVALADSATDIVDALVMKGVLTEEEGRLITKGHTSKTNVTPVLKEKDKNFTIESPNGENSISLTGRMHFDGRFYDYNQDDGSATTAASSIGADTFDIRRARIGVKYKFGKYYSGEVTTNLVGTSSDVLDVAYLDVAWFEKAKFRIGQFKMPFSLEQLTSSNNIDFIERSFVDSMIPAKERGIQISGDPVPGMTYALAVSNGNISTGSTASFGSETDNRVDNKDIIGRVTVNFAEMMKNKEAVFHLGGAFSQGEIPGSTAPLGSNSSSTFRTEARGLTYFSQPTINATNTSGLDKTIDRKRMGLEFAVASGPFKLQSQYLKVDHEFAGTSADVKTYYIEGLWTLTGEKHADRYKSGAFGGIKPNKEFDANTFTGGAWEIGARLSGLDLNDFKNLSATTGYTAGAGAASVKAYTLGVKFLPNMNSRFMLDYVNTDFEDLTSTGALSTLTVNGRQESQEKAVLFRSQFMF